ncbi:MAG: hypothetical protein JST92_26935, partial [Deltaproteobacteria bacterium]|nr:hypothetical protein [Deltaproteobacteria bacterium]
SADAPQGTREHILQANTSDATFLRRLAQKQGKHVRIEGTKLVVGEPPQGAELSIKPGDGLRRVRLKMKAGAQVGEVSVTGYDSRTKQAFTGTARPQGEVGEGARTHGRGASLTFNGHEVQPPDAATAEQMAQGRLRKLAESHLVAELDLMGDARHLPGATLGLDGFGPQLDGSFRVDRAQHTFHKFAYHTRLKAVRTARKRVPVRRDRPEPVRNDWIELELVDHTGHPVVGQQYRVETMTGEVFEGRLDSRGKARINGVRPGSNHVSFPGYVNEWRRA